MSSRELKELEHLLELELIDKARENLLPFTMSVNDSFIPTDFHKTYYKVLDLFAKGKIKNLMITVPPQHGKSEGSTRQLPSFLLGRNPDLKIAVASYSDTFAKKFNRDVQRIIDSKEYHKVFKDTVLNKSNVVNVSENYLRNASEFEIVGKKGGLKAVGRGGPLTGNKVDVIVMDDLYKDYMEGNSPVIREAVWDWYTSVVRTRLHNDSQQLIVFTRWHEDDLIGRIEKAETVKTINSLNEVDGSEQWVKINFEAIKTGQPTELDPRNKGEALWPSVHSSEKLNKDREFDPVKFQCLYQGNPKNIEGMLYSEFKTYTTLPDGLIIKSYTDTADTGADYLCSIVYGQSNDGYCYLIDVVYTQEPMEVTESLVSDQIKRHKSRLCYVESNNGGRSFARKIDELTDPSNEIKWFSQSKNKESRIYSNSSQVSNMIVMPKDWHVKFPEFYDHTTNYKRMFKANKHDDCADVLTGIIEKTQENNNPLIIW